MDQDEMDLVDKILKLADREKIEKVALEVLGVGYIYRKQEHYFIEELCKFFDWDDVAPDGYILRHRLLNIKRESENWNEFRGYLRKLLSL